LPAPASHVRANDPRSGHSRARTRTLNALRETQIEQGQQIAEQAQRIVELRSDMTVGFSELRSDMSSGFSMVGVGMAQITALLTTHLRECPGEA
jgi:hypothetical protein